MRIDILTLFPEMFVGPFDTSMLKKAQDNGLVKINIHNLRDWATDKHKTVDDRPYGGGPGMILRVDVIDSAISNFQFPISSKNKRRIILLSAKGETYNQKIARKLSKLDHLILLAGHYEGVDERVAKHLVDGEISIGNYVLTGGEIPTMVVVDSIVRLIPGVLKQESLKEESFSKLKIENSKISGAWPLGLENYSEYPQYTRPEEYKDWKVPKVLLSGNHAEIEKWRKEKSKSKSG